MPHAGGVTPTTDLRRVQEHPPVSVFSAFPKVGRDFAEAADYELCGCVSWHHERVFDERFSAAVVLPRQCQSGTAKC